MDVMQAQAVDVGLHQLLLNCVADTHALLALKAFQPSQQQPSAAIAQTAPNEHPQATATGKPAGHGKRPAPKRRFARGLDRSGQSTFKGAPRGTLLPDSLGKESLFLFLCHCEFVDTSLT